MGLGNESEILVDRKSKFQARCCALNDQNSISLLLDALIRENKSIAKASHRHMYAWRTGQLKQQQQSTEQLASSRKKKQNKLKNNSKDKMGLHGTDSYTDIQQGCSDCGEAGAGQRLLTLLERSNAINVLVIVTRWYGGIPLGSARFRHISSTAVESMKRGKFIH